jgi:site-specific DNA-methyltransferase (adenine-specific)
MFNTKGLMSSKKMDWETPRHILDWVEGCYGKFFDPCPKNPDFNGLKIEWKDINFVNPPYGTEIKHWIKKSYEESRKGKVVVLLIPSRTDTKWWHEYCMKANAIFFIKGRITFRGDHKGSAPFPSCIVIFDINSSEELNINPLSFEVEDAP